MTEYLKKFNPSNEDHVMWLADIAKVMKDAGGGLKRMDIEKELRKNPMGVEISKSDLIEFPRIHMIIAVKYTNAIFTNQAWIPPPE